MRHMFSPLLQIKWIVPLVALSVFFVPANAATPKSWCNGLVIPNYKVMRDGKTNIPISGTVRRVTNWGPPNFGENPKTDSKFQSWMLYLDAPFTALLSETRGSKEKFTSINIGAEGKDRELEGLRNKHVRIEGDLVAPENVPYQDASAISIIVSSIRQSPEVVCGAKQR